MCLEKTSLILLACTRYHIHTKTTTTLSFIEQTGTANMRIIGTGMFSRTGSFIVNCTTKS